MNHSFTLLSSVLFFLFSTQSSFSQMQFQPLPPESGFETRIKSFVDNIELVDTHEHLIDERSVSGQSLDFMLLLEQYSDDDIKSAGMSKPQFAELLTDKYTIAEKWEILEPYWEASKHTNYNRTILLAINHLYGIQELNAETVTPLSEKMRTAYKDGWYEHILKERANVKYAILDVGSNRLDSDSYRYVEKFDPFIRIHSKQEILALGNNHGSAVSSLEAYVDVLEKAFQEAVDRGIVGVKSALAYHRTLDYENVAKPEAEDVFKKIIAGDAEETYRFEEVKPFQDYIMHQIIRLAGEYELPIQFHTGLQAGDGNIIDNSDPSHLANLFLEYRDVKFVLFHGSYPYGGIAATQAKSFRNVYLDMCWSALISASYSERYLHEWIETVPSNKIMAFGGDYHYAEGSYGHSLVARNVVSNVLIEKVKTGYLTEAEAIEIAQRILHDNAVDLYKIR